MKNESNLMRKLITHLILVHTIVLLSASAGIWYVMRVFYPEKLIQSFYIIPLFFYLMGLAFVLILRKMPKDQPKRMVNLYMLLRALKLFVSAILIAVYWFMYRNQIRSFAIVFIMFYLIYLMVETYIYTKMEIFIKAEHQKNKSKKKSEDQ